MKILELFAGSRSIGKMAESLGHEVFSIDINDFENIDLAIDILVLNKEMIPFEPDMVWASPPCTYFSVASIGKHWNPDHTPKSENALLGMKILEKTIEIISWYSDPLYFIENPRGKMRKKIDDIAKKYQLNNFTRETVFYCKYGDSRAKTTDLWTNNSKTIFNPNGWIPRPLCKNYKYDADGNIIDRHCHHESARRGASTGTQGLKGNYERSKIPTELCREILESINRVNDKPLKK